MLDMRLFLVAAVPRRFALRSVFWRTWKIQQLGESASGIPHLEGDGGRWGRGKTVKLTVSSLRVDTVAAAGLGISRQYVSAWTPYLILYLMLTVVFIVSDEFKLLGCTCGACCACG